MFLEIVQVMKGRSPLQNEDLMQLWVFVGKFPEGKRV